MNTDFHGSAEAAATWSVVWTGQVLQSGKHQGTKSTKRAMRRDLRAWIAKRELFGRKLDTDIAAVSLIGAIRHRRDASGTRRSARLTGTATLGPLLARYSLEKTEFRSGPKLPGLFLGEESQGCHC